MKTISVSNLKKLLSTKSKDELINELVGLFSSIQQVKEYYTIASSNEGENAVLEKYRTIIENEFFPTRGNGKARLSFAKKAISNFKKLSSNANSIIDLMLCYVEQGVHFTAQYGDIDAPFYDSMEKMFWDALTLIEKSGMYLQFKERCEDIIDNACDGWGFKDTLTGLYEQKFP